MAEREEQIAHARAIEEKLYKEQLRGRLIEKEKEHL